MSGRNGKYIHGSQLKSSTPDHVALGMAIDDRFVVLCSRYKRVTGNELIFPKSMDRDVMRWRQLRVRHKKGDYRHTDVELASMHLIAQWTVDTNNVLCDQPVSKPLDWNR